MKKKIIAALLAGMACFSLTACESGSAESALQTESSSSVSEEEYQAAVPEVVTNLSEEEDQALTGVLTGDSYTNPYFGFQFNKPEGGTILSLMDDGTDLMPFKETYSNGSDGMHINIRTADNEASVSVAISVPTEKEQGKTEEELAQDKAEQEKSLNEGMGITTSEISVDTISVAGEEHPAYVEWNSDEDGDLKSAIVFIIKNDFLCMISVSSVPEDFDRMLELIGKI